MMSRKWILMVTFTNETFMNDTKTEEWIDDQLDLLKENYLDGINIDYEYRRQAAWIPNLYLFSWESIRKNETFQSYYQLTYCTSEYTLANPELFYSSTIRTSVDYFMIMAYDNGMSKQGDKCYGSANQPPEVVIK